jgi:hypothetical protein
MMATAMANEKREKGDVLIVEEAIYPNWVRVPDDLEFCPTCVGEIVTDMGYLGQELPRVWGDRKRRLEVIRQLRAAARALEYAERGESLYRAQVPGQLFVFYGVL